MKWCVQGLTGLVIPESAGIFRRHTANGLILFRHSKLLTSSLFYFFWREVTLFIYSITYAKQYHTLKPVSVPESGDWSVEKRLLGLFKPYRRQLLLALLGTLYFGLTNSALALIIAAMMELFAGASSAALSHQTLSIHLSREFLGINVYDLTLNGADEARAFVFLLAMIAVGLVLMKDVVFFAKEYTLWKVTNGALTGLKARLFERVVRLPLSFYDREKSGDVIARVTYDVTQLEGAIRSAINISKSMLYTVIYLAGMFAMNWSLTLVAMTIFPLSAVLIKQFGGRMRRAARNLSLNVADYTAFMTEATSGARAIKAFGQEGNQARSFGDKLKENYRWAMKSAKYAAINSPAQETISTLGSFALVVYCGLRIINGTITVGDLTGFIVLLSNAYKPIKDLGEVTGTLQRAAASSRRIFEILDEPDEADIIGSGQATPEIHGRIDFENVRFAYAHDKEVLRGINLSVKQGETLALVGPSGGGKSTVMSLIPRFYPLTSGSIRLDGRNTAEFDIAYLRRHIAYVPQETILFSGSIEQNILFGRQDASAEEVIAAAKAANALEFIERLPDGMESEVGERGVQLSGGQRQRIAIARAILRDPKILLLDEATSALDSESERLVQEALDRLRANRTTIIIAHRLSTIQNSDRIAVIVDGQIVELGTHAALMATAGVYRRLCEQQFGAGLA